MSEYKLPRDAEALLCRMYQRYLLAREDGVDRFKATNMGSVDEVRLQFCADESNADVLALCFALQRTGLLHLIEAGGGFYDSYLTDDAIWYMESRFKRNLEAVLQHIEALLGAVL